jgi:hypothetical protein
MRRHRHKTRMAAAALTSLLAAALLLRFATGSALAAVPRAFGHGFAVPAQSGSATTAGSVFVVVAFFAAVGIISTIGWRVDRRRLRREPRATPGASPKQPPTYADAIRRSRTWHGHAA